jgi:hypothetical protein
MSDSDRHAHNDHINKIEHEEEDLIRQLNNFKIEKERYNKSGRGDKFHEIQWKIMNLEKQIDRFIADFRTLENSCQDFDREMHYIYIYKELAKSKKI